MQIFKLSKNRSLLVIRGSFLHEMLWVGDSGIAGPPIDRFYGNGQIIMCQQTE